MKQMQGQLFCQQFKILSRVSRGRSSFVYQTVSIKTGDVLALKIQKKQHKTVMNQATVLLNIQGQIKIPLDYGMPLCHHASKQQPYNILVEDLLSQNIQNLLQKCKGVFSMKNFLMVAQQTFKRVQFLHGKGYVHRSLSLRKFVVGRKDKKKIYLVGLGRSKRFVKDEHILYQQGKKSHSELAYMSINSHMGLQHSRRDDMQSLMYCWVKMLKGKLPWQQQISNEKVLGLKILNRGQLLFKGCPQILGILYDQIRTLGFMEEPNYNRIIDSLRQICEEEGLQCDYDYQWQHQPNK